MRLPSRPRDIQRMLTEHYRCDPQQLHVYDQDEWNRAAGQRPGAGAGQRGGAVSGARSRLDIGAVAAALGPRGQVCHSLDDTLATIQAQAKPGTQVLIMSNGGFGGIHERLLQSLQAAGR